MSHKSFKIIAISIGFWFTFLGIMGVVFNNNPASALLTFCIIACPGIILVVTGFIARDKISGFRMMKLTDRPVKVGNLNAPHDR